MIPHATREAIDVVWRIESARLIGGLVRVVRDLGLAEDLAQEALVAALERWPTTGIPEKPGAWLMVAAKNRAIDELRRRQMQERNHAALSHASREVTEPAEEAGGHDVSDDVLGSSAGRQTAPTTSPERYRWQPGKGPGPQPRQAPKNSTASW